MRFSPQLIEAVLIRRYKRFLADVRLADGSVITAHVANTGSMSGLDTPGLRVWLRDSQNDARKYRYSWELVDLPGKAGRLSPNVLVSVNTGTANLIVREAIERGLVDELCGYDTVRPRSAMATAVWTSCLREERWVWTVARTFAPLRVTNRRRGGLPGPDCYVEVKSVTLVENGVALFPDSVSARGTKHLEELGRIAAGCHRAVVFFCGQRGDADEMQPADAIDPEFCRTLRSVMDSGVEAMAWAADISPAGVRLNHALPVSVNG